MKHSAKTPAAFLKIALLSGAAFALQGCVAAVVPIAAGGLLTGASPSYKPSTDTQTREAAALARSADGADGADGADAANEISQSAAAASELTAPETNLARTAETEIAAQAPGLAPPIEDIATTPAPAVEAPARIAEAAAPSDLASAVDTPEQSASELLPEIPSQPETPALGEVPAGPATGPVANSVALAVSEPETQISASATGTLEVAEADLAAASEIDPSSTLGEAAQGFAPAPATSASMGADTGAAQPAPETQLLDIREQGDFAEATSETTSVSAADAAAALTTLPAAQEPAVDASRLARSAPTAAQMPTAIAPANTAPTAAPAGQPQAAQATALQSGEQAGTMPQINTPIDPAPAAAALAAVEPAIDAPTSATEQVSALRRAIPAPNAITSLLSYANQRSMAAGEMRQSAMLADRFTPTAERIPCRALQPVVVIDLDPQGGLFDPTQGSRPPSGLGAGLAQLRSSGVKIAWLSGNPASAEEDIRDALMQSTLDLFGNDLVLLISQPDQRKQTLREDLALTYCVVAIAGDEREDFDELYGYLRNPNDAQPLDVLYGEGWFIIPQPIVTETPNP